jgi:hypothetical protein
MISSFFFFTSFTTFFKLGEVDCFLSYLLLTIYLSLEDGDFISLLLGLSSATLFLITW